MPECKACKRSLVLNERLSERFKLLFGIEHLKVYYCLNCLDDLYVLNEGKIYSGDEWRKVREELRKRNVVS